jgi:CHAD domain-containing protein
MPDDPTRTGDTLALHLRSSVEKRLQKLEACLDFSASESPVEAVHALRVASRRLRAFAMVFRGLLGAKTLSRLERGLKRVTKAAGAMRDWDVQSMLVEARLAGAASDLERACLEQLLEQFAAERRRARQHAEKRLRKLDAQLLRAAVERALEEAVSGLPPGASQPAYARELLERLIENAADRVPPQTGSEDVEQLHRLRISIKQLRYALELFEPLLGPGYDALHQRATSLQELLGTHRDLTVLAEGVQRRADELEQNQRHTLAAGLRIVHEAFAAQRQQVLEAFMAGGFAPAFWRENLDGALSDAGSP